MFTHGLTGQLRRSAWRRRLRRWQARPGIDDLVITPPDLRAVDPGFALELAEGRISLGGGSVAFGARSPFAISPPTAAWHDELHGFDWLRHLAAAPAGEAAVEARRLALDWIDRRPNFAAGVHAPAIRARRIMSWLAHAGLLLDDADVDDYDTIAACLAAEIKLLARQARGLENCREQATVLIALAQSSLCMADGNRALPALERQLAALLARQVLGDGGHISRNASDGLELLLDLMPLSQLYATRGFTPPPMLADCIRRLGAMLRTLRLGDGALARCNGVGPTPTQSLATVLAHVPAAAAGLTHAADSGYVRLAAGATVVLLDAGAAPPPAWSHKATAGCLAFELSSGTAAILVNLGTLMSASAADIACARATASHNALVVANTSSATLWPDPASNAAQLRFGGAVEVRRDSAAEAGSIAVTAAHTGYKAGFGITHRRRIALAADGDGVCGHDLLTSDGTVAEPATPVPFALHFHLHPAVATEIGAAPGDVLLQVAGGEVWRFSCAAARLTLESVPWHGGGSSKSTLRIVLTGSHRGRSEIAWRVVRLKAGSQSQPPAVSNHGLASVWG